MIGKIPPPADIEEELRETKLFHDIVNVQNGEAIRWLEANGFDCVPARDRNGCLLPGNTITFDRSDFERTLKNCQPIPGPHTIRPRPKAPKGRKRGTGPYVAADRVLYPEIKRLMTEENLSGSAATQRLKEEGKIAGPTGEKGSRAKRLHKRFTLENS